MNRTDMELLQDLYKFDLTVLLNTLKPNNFIDYYDIIRNILNTETVDKRLKQQFGDKIIDFCLGDLLNKETIEKLSNLNGSNGVESTTTIDYQTVIFKYLRLCLQYASREVYTNSLVYYTHHFIKCINLNTDHRLKLSNVPETYSNTHRYERQETVPFNIDEIQTLNNYFSIIIQLFKENINDLNDKEKQLIDCLIEFSLQIIYETDNLSVIKMCINTIEKLVKLSDALRVMILTKCHEIVVNLGNKRLMSNSLFEKKRLESHSEDSNLALLTSLADYYIDVPAKYNFCLESHQYWYLLQSALTHTNALTRKRALYLLKRVVDFSTVNKIKVVARENNVGNTQVPLFDADWSIWNDYFLCVELFEESAIHVIKPCLPKVNNLLMDVKSGKFHFTWILVLLERAFFHESKFMVRWSVLYVFQSKLHDLLQATNLYPTENTIQLMNQFIMGPLIVVLQEGFLYYRVDEVAFDEKCPVIALNLAQFLNNFVNQLPEIVQKTTFLENLTQIITSYTWNSPCLMFLAKSFYDLDLGSSSSQIISSKIIRNIFKILTNSINTQEVLMRSAIQVYFINAIIKHLKSIDLNDQLLRDVIDVINTVSMKESVEYSGRVWDSLVQWLKPANFNQKSLTSNNDKDANYIKFLADFFYEECMNFYNKTDLVDFTITNYSLKLSKMFLIFGDTCETIVEKSYGIITDRLLTINRYLYGSTQKLEKCLFMFNNMLKFITGSKFTNKNSYSYQVVKQLYNQVVIEILSYLLRKANDTNEQALNFNSVESYTELLQNLLNFNHALQSNTNSLVMKKLREDYLQSILVNVCDAQTSQKFSAKWKTFISLSYFSILVQSSYEELIYQELLKTNNNTKFIQIMKTIQIPTKSSVSNLERDLPKEIIDNLFENFSLFSGKYLEIIWKNYNFMLRNNKLLSTNVNDVLDEMLNKYEQSIDLNTPPSLAPFIESTQSFIICINSTEKVHEYTEKFFKILNMLYESIWGIYSDVRYFNIAYNSLLDVFFSPKLFTNTFKDAYSKFIKEIIDDIILKSKEKCGMIKPVLDKLIAVLKISNKEFNFYFIKVFVEFLIIGDVYKKEKRYIKDIEIYIESLGENFGTNQLIRSEYLHDSGVRVCTLYYLLNEKGLDEAFFNELTDVLIQKDSDLSFSNQKLYINSIVHRERFRLWQSVLFLLQRLNKAQYDKILEYADRVLLTESQPSNRVLLEWIFIKIYLSTSIDLKQLWSKTDTLTPKKVGYTCSWISICAHLCQFIEEEKRVEYFKTLISFLLSQILSPNFHIRTYAESTFIKLYAMINEDRKTKTHGLNNEKFTSNPEIKSLVSIIHSIIKPTIDDKERHANIIIDHFYFQFNPISNYSINTIFNIFPLLCGISEDEIIDDSLFVSLVLNKQYYECTESDIRNLNLSINLRDTEKNLENCKSGVWKFTAYKDDSTYEPAVSIEDLQKKITPWHTLIPKQQDFESMTKNRKLNTYSDVPGLILVASLIDKGPNLGGLARTCEIFNVKQFVLGNMRFIEDKQFQSLAVTADKWLNMIEVPIKYLKTYLTEMKYRGYTLIGVEQTANSVKLHEYKFPKNSLLLLGNEKEGIPVELIQLLDVCVEIPQLGIVRSLNVHVSAAITIWEYTKQNLKS